MINRCMYDTRVQITFWCEVVTNIPFTGIVSERRDSVWLPRFYYCSSNLDVRPLMILISFVAFQELTFLEQEWIKCLILLFSGISIAIALQSARTCWNSDVAVDHVGLRSSPIDWDKGFDISRPDQLPLFDEAIDVRCEGRLHPKSVLQNVAMVVVKTPLSSVFVCILSVDQIPLFSFFVCAIECIAVMANPSWSGICLQW